MQISNKPVVQACHDFKILMHTSKGEEINFKKKRYVFFLLLSFLISQINHATTLVWFFFKMCTFSYGHLFLVSIFYQLTSEKNQVHTGDLTHCKQTLQLIKFYLIKNMKGNRGNWLAQFKFPFLSILWSFLLP